MQDPSKNIYHARNLKAHHIVKTQDGRTGVLFTNTTRKGMYIVKFSRNDSDAIWITPDTLLEDIECPAQLALDRVELLAQSKES